MSDSYERRGLAKDEWVMKRVSVCALAMSKVMNVSKTNTCIMYV